MVGIGVLEFGHAEIFSCSFDESFLDFFVDFPEFDVAVVGGQDFLVASLSSEPAEAGDGFFYLHAAEGVELFGVGLELHKVF